MALDFSGFRASPLCRNQDESDRNADSRLTRPRSDGSDEISDEKCTVGCRLYIVVDGPQTVWQ